MTESSHFTGRYHSFAIVAVRCNDNESIGKKKLETRRIYYLLDGYSVKYGKTDCQLREEIDVLYDDFLDADNLVTPHVIVSAIVVRVFP